MEENNENIDDVIEEFESRLNDLYDKKDDTTSAEESKPVFNVPVSQSNPESVVEESSSSLISESKFSIKDYLWTLYLILPVVFSGIIYYLKPKQIKKGSKIDNFKFLRLAFLVTVVCWIGVFSYINYTNN